MLRHKILIIDNGQLTVDNDGCFTNTYKTLMIYMEVNCYKYKKTKDIIACFEKVYEKDSVCYMDVFIAIES
ncbi:hypothetical protein [Haloimpatiens lingqiaonensis]|uniref:hypothetical protein n=1 Tax=Haloimpatiens lingqiaonensis TaxID=1380675 RepID=UPI0010FDAFD1|nr:hypothetical protein [Haloimpatiens lingqiaonensis]